MNSSAPSIQRTGQPRWVQFAENAMKCSAVSRRSHAEVFAVMPAHGSGDGSSKVIVTVLPTVKSFTLPTGSHVSGVLRKSGAITNPTSGTPSIAAQTPPSMIESFSKKPRRLITSGRSEYSELVGGWVFSFMANIIDPTAERDGEKSDADGEDDPRSDESPKNEGDREPERRGPVGR